MSGVEAVKVEVLAADSEVEAVEMVTAPEKKGVIRVFEALVAGQARSGTLTMMDCRKVGQSVQRLRLVKDDGETEKEEVEAIQFLVAAANCLTRGKAYTWDETLSLLQDLESVEKWVNEKKSARCLKRELLEEKRKLKAAAQ